MNVILIGYRASGKTLVGRKVAARLGWLYRDVDRDIERRAGSTIRDIFGEQGETVFRKIERSVTRERLAGDRQVIAFGGGTFMQAPEETWKDDRAFVVYLEAPIEVLTQRMANDPDTEKNRPNLLAGGVEEIVTMLERRAPMYRAVADLTLDATRDPDELAEVICAAIRDREEG